MAFQRWQIGLDIQNGQLCALGIERRRHGWQLRHWWQQPLPHDTLRNGVLQTTPLLQEMLTRWQRHLPKRYSLRVGLPPQLVLQRTLPLPETSLSEPAMSRYVASSAPRLFPVEPATLSIDYRSARNATQLCITAARREVIAQWLAPLKEAGLRPDVFELSSLALTQIAMRMPLHRDQLLIHPLSDHWLWTLAGEPGTSGAATEPLTLAKLRETFPQASSIFCTSAFSLNEPSVTHCRPLSLLHYRQPPLPAQEGEFAIALGLALRPEDA
ncbi:pilus assembly protein PilM [Enterobacter cancerogenus]|uniref:pilus assembly protein PilM n=1 Tax=Enterobacter cancerogenus TaxID=69218 RepID=UPI0005367899|nr:pilus assembly protein PilM [Enterobacter cancerogenus]KGT93930.1 pilus assembly protein HofM [Enterobacter cancerogenus]